MSDSSFYRFDAIQNREIARGFLSKLIHTASNIINFIEVEAGNTVPPHRHFNEQCSFVIDGKFELSVNVENATAN